MDTSSSNGTNQLQTMNREHASSPSYFIWCQDLSNMLATNRAEFLHLTCNTAGRIVRRQPSTYVLWALRWKKVRGRSWNMQMASNCCHNLCVPQHMWVLPNITFWIVSSVDNYVSQLLALSNYCHLYMECLSMLWFRRHSGLSSGQCCTPERPLTECHVQDTNELLQ